MKNIKGVCSRTIDVSIRTPYSPYIVQIYKTVFPPSLQKNKNKQSKGYTGYFVFGYV